ncbi:MAG: acetate/propionate family kinase, partial [Nanoarchaeota archaeon]
MGSSSLKYQFFDDEVSLFKGHVDGIGLDRCAVKMTIDGETQEEQKAVKTQKEAVKTALKSLQQHGVIESYKDIDAVGHRVVHGGDYFKEAALINNSCISYIKIFSELAPLHNPNQLNGIMAVKSYMPDVKQVAVFDTAFHQTIPEKAHMYALPLDYYKKHKIRKYGFHGISHKYVSEETNKLLRKKHSSIIVCHLGNGSSITAVKDGESVETSMGFTPVDGLVMGTRTGEMDPLVPLFLQRKFKMTPDEIEHVMNHESGFKGLTQMVSDLRDVYGLAQKNNAKAVVAMDMFIHRIVSFIGAYAAVMNGLDAIAFTGGIGENAEYIRTSVCDNLSYLGVKIDKRRNKNPDGEISASSSDVKLYVIPTDEEL